MLRVMSFNIRYGLANDGDNHWNHRRGFAVERIRAFDPDLLGLQECRDDEDQAGFLRQQLMDYQWHAMRRGGPGDTALEMAPLLFKPTRFQLLEGGHFWLSETPQVSGSMSWGCAYPRTLSWVRLHDLASDRPLLYLNTHFDYEPDAIEGDARVLRQWLDLQGADCALILSGDFNADKHSAAYAHLTGFGLQDALSLFDPQQADAPTFHAYGVTEEMAALDWILLSSHLQVQQAQVDRSQRGPLYPSDHYPLTAVLDWG